MPIEPVPEISVIIPVHNGASFLRRCLEAVLASDGPSYECIVVDDGSNDGSKNIAAQFGNRVRLLNLHEGPRGPAYARNRGAEIARGAILFFVDADVVLARGAVQRLATTFSQQPDLAAVFGSYDANPEARGLVSRYRNLLHHFVHQNGNPNASTFWAGCGAICRSVFEKVGGFDERRFPRPSIEDIERGYRLREAGHRIVLDKGLQGTHLKRWTLGSVIKTDVFCRAIPWARLILERKNAPNDLNLKRSQRLSGSLVMLACPLAPLGLFQVELFTLPLAAVLGATVLNRDLYLFFFRQHGLRFAAPCVLLHLLYYLYSSLSYIFVLLTLRLKILSDNRPYST